MKKFKKRLLKKYYKRVAADLENGNVSLFHARKVGQALAFSYDKIYITRFRPWWYEDIEKWSERNLSTEIIRFTKDWKVEIEKESGVNVDKLDGFLKNLPKKPKKRKPRKEKAMPPVRKLKHPEEFKVKYNNGIETVIGEIAFRYKGYDFFIRYDKWCWVVSDVTCGFQVSRSERYKKAVSSAKEKISNMFDQYLEWVKTHAIEDGDPNG
jgi:hypothetical protein